MTYSVDDEPDFVDSAVGLWTNEVPQLDTRGKHITNRILRLAEVVTNRMNDVTQSCGIKYSTYAILATLRASGEPFELTPKALQALLVVSSGGLSNQLARIEAMGLIRRSEDPSDGRGVRVSLTLAGRALADQTMPVQAAAELDFIRMLSEDERETLERLLRRVLLVNSIPR
ncbi:MarR family winged helix-turn-helix transcriptional regulator [Paracoccus shanxieyensis]|uniref:MarR family transcriptional regulator n=1 Tax=Paracoccus shanxieyensis TaxID=2675752 RepID=A0A6L6J5N1_9RHOB|nr:MarR family transcriptional regulator [Paracoccus shanxieyensis]MTH66672.1 MarR family transcriptional regulator [Paracoccus shanxieyensis]MTH89907.1 MarR family transcriptional regulator [Paracoccus shanxieyensis]